MPSMLNEVARAFDAAGVDLAALGLAWARAAPAVAIVPAFGLRALPAPARGVLGLALAAAIFPALGGIAVSHEAAPWPLLLVEQVLRGLPIAIAAAVPLWAATMAGGVVDALRGASDAVSVPVIEGKATPLGVPLSLLASAIFLATGGPARVVAALALGAAGAEAMGEGAGAHPVMSAARDLVGGISLAVAIGGPLLVAAIVLEVGGALVARAASPAQIHALLSPLRALGVLAVMAVVLDRIAAVLAAAVR